VHYYPDRGNKKAVPHMKDGSCIQMDRFDYSAGVASTEASGVAVGFTVALGVAVALPLALAEGDALSATGDSEGVAFTDLLIS
jgi:hypothetical protein